MRRWTLRILVSVAMAAVLAGCIPKRVVWSPDGKLAAVVGNDGLYLCDEDGNLSQRVAEGVETEVTAAAWYPDSRRLLVVRQRPARTWEEVVAALPAGHQKDVKELAGQIRAAILDHDGRWDEFSVPGSEKLTYQEQLSAKLYVRDRLSDGLAEKMGEHWKDFSDVEASVNDLQVYEITGPMIAAPRGIVSQSVNSVGEPHISPDGRYVAYISEMAGTDFFRLWVVPADGSEGARPVDDLVAYFPDWSADGRYLVYAKATFAEAEGSDTVQLGSITRREVCDEQGALLEEFSGGDDLAGLIFSPWIKVCCLRDGRVLFASAEVALPATAKDMPEYASLFAVHPGRQATVTRVVPRSTSMIEFGAWLALGAFEVSPDEDRVTLLGEGGTVAVFDIATGHLERVQPDQFPSGQYGAKIPTPPVWRSSEQLCFAVPTGSEMGSPERGEIVLWSREETRAISKSWPDEVAGFLKP